MGDLSLQLRQNRPTVNARALVHCDDHRHARGGNRGEHRNFQRVGWRVVEALAVSACGG